MPRPSIKSPCVADRHANKPVERIAEFSSGAIDNAGGLFSIRDEMTAPGVGVLVLNLYNLDKCRVHVDPAALGPQTLRAAAKLYAEQNPGLNPDIFERDTPADLSGGDPGYHLITSHGAVILTLEAADRIERKAAFATVADAEKYLTISSTIDPDDLAAGRYGIDAPHGVSDDEARPLAEKLGFRIYTTGAEFYFVEGPPEAPRNGWQTKYPNPVAAAFGALATVEP